MWCGDWWIAKEKLGKRGTVGSRATFDAARLCPLSAGRFFLLDHFSFQESPLLMSFCGRSRYRSDEWQGGIQSSRANNRRDEIAQDVVLGFQFIPKRWSGVSIVHLIIVSLSSIVSMFVVRNISNFVDMFLSVMVFLFLSFRFSSLLQLWRYRIMDETAIQNVFETWHFIDNWITWCHRFFFRMYTRRHWWLPTWNL